MKKILAGVFAAVLLAIAQPTTVQAQGMHLPDNWYFELMVPVLPFGGANEREGQLFGVSADIQLDCEGCAGLQATLGGYIADNVRAEYQFTYLHVGVTSIEIFGGPFPIAGNIDVFTNMFNLLYEFQLDAGFVPFVGGGLGFSVIDPDNVGGFGTFTNGSDIAFTAAVIVGIDVPITELVTFTTRYSLGYTSETEHSTTGAPGDYKLDDEFNHLVSAGLRFDLSELRAFFQ